MEFYAVSTNKKVCTKNTVTIEEHIEKGYEVKESRKPGVFNVYGNGYHVSTLFPTKKMAMEYFSDKTK